MQIITVKSYIPDVMLNCDYKTKKKTKLHPQHILSSKDQQILPPLGTLEEVFYDLNSGLRIWILPNT